MAQEPPSAPSTTSMGASTGAPPAPAAPAAAAPAPAAPTPSGGLGLGLGTGGMSSLSERRGRPTLQVRKIAPPDLPSFDGRSIRKIVPPEKFEDIFEFREKLYESGGATCQVVNATCKKTGKNVIVKMRNRRFAVGGESVWRSLLNRMLNLEAHSHVLGLNDVLEDENHYYIVMERMSGGELFDFLQTETDVPERECKRIMREILEAVDHIHARGLIHRDIKPENIMFHDTTRDEATPTPMKQKKAIKLIDFDTCQEYEPMSPKAKHVVGTMGYIAPEALQGEYSPSSDLWSVGVILYILMTGDMPFPPDVFGEDPSDTRCGSSSMNELYNRLQGAQIDFDCEPWPSFPQARDLCMNLLAFSPGDRSPSARAALNHPWLIS